MPPSAEAPDARRRAVRPDARCALRLDAAAKRALRTSAPRVRGWADDRKKETDVVRGFKVLFSWW